MQWQNLCKLLNNKLMKLESLKSSKFEAFKSNEVGDLMSISGGRIVPTHSSANICGDTYDDSSNGRGGAYNEKDCKDCTTS